jgi:hypothetical protein
MQRVLASLVLLEGLALAQPTPDQAVQAKQLFEDGRKLAGDSKWQQACDTFAKSYALDPAIGTELNIGDCQEHLGHLAIAWHMFDDAAKKDTDADRVKYAHDRAATLAPKLATVTIKLPDPGVVGLVVKVAGNPVPPAAEITTMVDPGDVAIEVAAPGRAAETRSVQATAGQTAVVDLGSAAPPPSPPHPDAVPATVSTSHRLHSRVVMAETITAIGGAGLVTGVALGLVARSKYNGAFPSHCTSMEHPVCDSDGYATTSNAITLANVGTAFAVAGVAAMIAGGVVYFTAPKELVVTPTASGQAAGIAISGTF